MLKNRNNMPCARFPNALKSATLSKHYHFTSHIVHDSMGFVHGALQIWSNLRKNQTNWMNVSFFIFIFKRRIDCSKMKRKPVIYRCWNLYIVFFFLVQFQLSYKKNYDFYLWYQILKFEIVTKPKIAEIFEKFFFSFSLPFRDLRWIKYELNKYN